MRIVPERPHPDWPDIRSLATAMALDRLRLYMYHRAVRLARQIQGFQGGRLESGTRVRMSNNALEQLDNLGLKPYTGLGTVSSKVEPENPFVRVSWDNGRSNLVAKDCLVETPTL